MLFLEGSIQSPRFSAEGRPEAGTRVHELRIRDTEHNWRVIYRIDEDRILIMAKAEGTADGVGIDLLMRAFFAAGGEIADLATI